VPTRTSRCSRFLTTLPSGTRWKNSRGPTPERRYDVPQRYRSRSARVGCWASPSRTEAGSGRWPTGSASAPTSAWPKAP
jgi:hypothetical protein